ncbi:hypothetical protein CGRA01v4_10246 [Colletotrichum graminicola]|nr:hypothetical protein CGRA01v4_10246 [Colletotrichum graminicola]
MSGPCPYPRGDRRCFARLTTCGARVDFSPSRVHSHVVSAGGSNLEHRSAGCGWMSCRAGNFSASRQHHG